LARFSDNFVIPRAESQFLGERKERREKEGGTKREKKEYLRMDFDEMPTCQHLFFYSNYAGATPKTLGVEQCVIASSLFADI